MKPMRLLALLLCLAMILCAAGCRSDASGGDRAVRLIMDTMPVNLDPQLAEDDETLLLVRNLFEGLFRVDGGKVVPAACASYDRSKDGLTYTFTLREGLKWSDGSDLVAADFRFGLVRALRPETKAPNAERLLAIVNAPEVLAGEANESVLGIEARDDRTLVIRLTRPDPDLTETLTYAMATPCREDLFLEAAGRYGMTQALTLSNGPFALSYWDGSSVRLTRNAEYVGDFTAKTGSVSVRYGGTDTERIQSVNNGFSDLILLNGPSAGIARDALLTTREFRDTTWLLVIRSDANVLGDPAVAAALRKALGDDVMADALPAQFTPANGILSNDLLVGTVGFGTLCADRHTVKSDIAAAKAALVESLKPYGGSLAATTLLYADLDGMKHTASHIAQQWQKELGVVVNIEARSRADLCHAVESGEYTMALYPLSADDGKAATQLRNYAEVLSGSQERRDAVNEASALPNPQKQADALERLQAGWLSDKHVLPIAQSGRCFAMTADLKGVEIDLCQGLIPLYRIG